MAMSGGSSRLVYTGYGNGRPNFPINVYVYYKTTENIDTNTSKIYCGMYVTTPGSAWDIGPWDDYNGSYVGTNKLTFNGNIPNFGGTRWLVEDKTFNVEHSQDGSGSATIYWKWGVNSSWARIQNISGSFTISLPTIPRASQPSCITFPNTTEDVGYMGNTITIHMNRASSSFTHKVRYGWHGHTKDIANNVASSCSWKIPIDFAKDIPTKTSSWGTIYVDTYSGGTKIGTKSVIFTAHVPNYTLSPVPATISLKNENAIINNWGIAIKGFTKLNWSLTPQESQYGNYITNYYLCLIPNKDNFNADNSICDLTNTTSTSGTTGYLTYAPGTYRVKMSAKDSRDKWSNYVLRDPSDSTKPLKLTIYDYSAPKIQNPSAFRCNGSGTAMDNGTYLSISCSGVVGTSIDGRNGVSTVYQWRVVGDEYNAKASIPDAPISEFPVTNAFDVKFTVRDTIGIEVQTVITIPLGKTDFHLTPYGAGFGMYHDSSKPNRLQSAWDLEIKDNLMTDFIIEQGTSGIWTYRKWYSGISECWGSSIVNTICSNQSGGVYFSDEKTISLPSGLFVRAPITNITCIDPWSWINTTSTNAMVITFKIIRGSNYPNAYDTTVLLSAKGNWK